MSGLEKAHLVLVCSWGGVVLAEALLELVAARGGDVRTVAEFHYWTDLAVEVPLVAGVLTTGAFLLAGDWPPSPLLWVKVVAALVAVGANLTCVAFVLQRRRAPDEEAARAFSGRIVWTGLGVPFALLAGGIGLARS